MVHRYTGLRVGTDALFRGDAVVLNGSSIQDVHVEFQVTDRRRGGGGEAAGGGPGTHRRALLAAHGPIIGGPQLQRFQIGGGCEVVFHEHGIDERGIFRHHQRITGGADHGIPGEGDR